MFTADEFEIIAFLKCFPGQYLSGKEVCRRAGSKRKYQENPRWALPLLVGLVVRGVVTSDAGGHYRLVEKEEQPRKSTWSPALGPSSDAPADVPIQIDEQQDEDEKKPEL